MAGNVPERVVLVIEDDPGVSSFLQQALTDDGYEVLLANTSDAALSSLDTVQPDLITLDLNLPGIGGAQLLRTIRQRPKLRQVVVVIVSGERHVEPALRDLAQAVVVKPFELSDLMATIRDLAPPPAISAEQEHNG
ncbi:MAG: response regulator [Ardenticatenaceae bacterium]|nr:response regulator [Ardenticatenaceae bacterium]